MEELYGTERIWITFYLPSVNTGKWLIGVEGKCLSRLASITNLRYRTVACLLMGIVCVSGCGGSSESEAQNTPVSGGWYFVSDSQGRLADCPACNQFWNPNTFKWSFVQHYIPLGLGALCEANHEDDVCDMFVSAKNDLLKMRDYVNGGYFDRADIDYLDPRDKSFASIVDALNTHAFIDSLNTAGLVEARELASITRTDS